MKDILIIGGNGALGRSVVKVFNKASWRTISLDLTANSTAAENREIKQACFTSEEAERISASLPELDMVVNVAGGWEGVGAVGADSAQSMQRMTEMSVYSSLLAAFLAKQKLKEACPLVLTGAAGVREETPDFMFSYALAKQNVHSLVSHINKNALLGKSKCFCILPWILKQRDDRH